MLNLFYLKKGNSREIIFDAYIHTHTYVYIYMFQASTALHVMSRALRQRVLSAAESAGPGAAVFPLVMRDFECYYNL